MALAGQILPLLLVVVIAGLIIARLINRRPSGFPTGFPAKPAPRPARPKPRRANHLRVVNKATMDRELNELLKNEDPRRGS
jgi:hypothetical protein